MDLLLLCWIFSWHRSEGPWIRPHDLVQRSRTSSECHCQTCPCSIPLLLRNTLPSHPERSRCWWGTTLPLSRDRCSLQAMHRWCCHGNILGPALGMLYDTTHNSCPGGTSVSTVFRLWIGPLHWFAIQSFSCLMEALQAKYLYSPSKRCWNICIDMSAIKPSPF